MKASLRWSIAVAIMVVVGLLAVALHESSPGELLELASYDWRMKLRGPLPAPEDSPISILKIDDASFDKIDLPLVFWQPLFAEVITALSEAEAAVVGVDMLFTDVDLVIDKFTADASQRTQSHVRQLAAAILNAAAYGTPVIIGFKGAHDTELPTSLFLAAGEDGVAYVNLTTDSDDFVRRQELYAQSDQGIVYSFAMAIARAYRGEDVPFTPIPGKPATMLINFRGRSPYPTVPFWEVVRAAQKQDREYFEQFRGRIILIGIVSEDDRHATPLYSWPDPQPVSEADRGSRFKRNPGVEIHAHTVATLLEGDFIRPLDWGGRVFWTFLLGGLATILCFLFSPTVGTLSALALAPVYLLGAQIAFGQGVWIPVTGPLAALFGAVAVAQLANYALEGREKRRLRSLFKRYVDDRVIEQILEKPDLILAGQRKRISVLFSDIRNFTTRSESMSPEALVELLNRYFELMVSAIQANQGTVDKFIGDGLMAVFGAPLDDADAAYHATRAALAMQVGLKELNIELEAEGHRPIRIGVGVHTGEAVVGNIGSLDRQEYTAIGDVVNTASRIEGLNKEYGTSILISEETYAGLNGRIPARMLAETHVKGRAGQIKVYVVDPQVEVADQPSAQAGPATSPEATVSGSS